MHRVPNYYIGSWHQKVWTSFQDIFSFILFVFGGLIFPQIKKSPLIVTLFSGQLWQNRCALIYMLYEMTSASIWHKEKETFLQFFMLNVCLTKLTYALNRIPLSSILIWPNYLTGLKSENSALQIELHDVLDYCNGSKVCITLYLDFMKFKLLLKTSIFSFLPTNQIR